jgi:hypothetical protein
MAIKTEKTCYNILYHGQDKDKLHTALVKHDTDKPHTAFVKHSMQLLIIHFGDFIFLYNCHWHSSIDSTTFKKPDRT